MEEEEGNENGSQVRAIGMGQRNKETLVWNNVPTQMTGPILPWKRDSEFEQFIGTLFFMSIYGLAASVV